jgi:hypothetical protein
VPPRFVNDIGSVTPPRDFLGILLSKALTRLLGVDLRLTRDFSRVLIIPQRDERAVAQVTGIRPFEESNLTDQLRFHPSALLHLLHGERFSPSRRFLLGKIGKWALLRTGLLDHRENLGLL